MVAWGPIIGAGISAIGSLLGGDDDQETTTTIDYKAMAKSAEKAGFNPLTAIRNGGSAGFVTTHHPGLSMATRMGNMFSTLGNAIMSFDERADERALLEEQLARAQLARLQGPTDGFRAMMFGDVPTWQGSTRVGPGGRPVAPAAAGVAADPGVNLLVNYPGGVAKPPFEPVTEYDELAVGIDQLTSDVKRVWKNDPFHKWWEQVFTKGPRANTPLRMPPAEGWRPPRRPYSPTPGYNPFSLSY